MTVEAIGEVAEAEPTGDGPDPELRVAFELVGPICLFLLSGELKASSVGVLEAQVDRLGRTPCRRVVVDLGAVDLVDETGARVLLGLRHYVRARGGRFSVVGAKPWVGTVLDAEEARTG